MVAREKKKHNKEHAQQNERQTHTQRGKREKRKSERERENQTVQYYAALIIGVIQFFIMPIMNGGKKQSKV